jgi:hypothetical protein
LKALNVSITIANFDPARVEDSQCWYMLALYW